MNQSRNLKIRLLTAALAIFLAAAACNLPTNTLATGTPGATGESTVNTLAAQTLEALRTDVASLSTITPRPSGNGTATRKAPTLKASSTSNPSATGSSTAKPTPCDTAGFVADVTVPDGTSFSAGANFTKTWRLRNNGTCTWSSSYAVAFDSGDAMNGPAAQNLTRAVPPGQTVDISLSLKAPIAKGEYKGNWKLRNASGVLFGTGSTNMPFFVDIKVNATGSVTPATNGYNFAANYCSAEWMAHNQVNVCPGNDGNTVGFVLRIANPSLETGYIDNEFGLLTNPPYSNQGSISGTFPRYLVKSVDHFKTIIGCEYQATKCDVTFELAYKKDDGTLTTLATWREKYDKHYTTVDFDLSDLTNQTVQFILKVTATNNGEGARALWLLPRITE